MNLSKNVSSLVHILSRNNLPLSSTSLRSYAFKSDLKIKWVRPEKIPCYKPAKSGDLDAYHPADPTQPQALFKDSKELATADEAVKKLFSLEFAPRRATKQIFYSQIIGKVQRHPYDVGSVEVKIARMTGVIRTLQDIMDRFPRNKRMKVFLKEMIDRRKKQLKYLRRWDYKRFEWLLEALDIVYKPPPNEFRWVTRRESLVKLTNKYCDDIKEERLAAYKTMLEAEKPLFLQEKIKALEFIRNEQKECGAEVTVTEEEIESVRKQLKDLEESRQ